MVELPVAENAVAFETPNSNGAVGVVRGFAADNRLLLVATGISLAGAAYPVVLLSTFGMFGMVFEGLRRLDQPPADIVRLVFAAFPALLMFLAIAVVAGAIGAIWAGFVSLIIVPVFYLFVRSLQLRTSVVWLGAICGGLVGFIAVLPIWLNTSVAAGFDSEYFIISLLGPGLTTALGQIGGAWGGRKAQLSREIALEYHLVPEVAPGPLLQFQIRHLLWVTVWLSLLLTAIRLSGIPFELILPVLIIWLLYQAATLYGGWLIFGRLLSWWAERRSSRST